MDRLMMVVAGLEKLNAGLEKQTDNMNQFYVLMAVITVAVIVLLLVLFGFVLYLLLKKKTGSRKRDADGHVTVNYYGNMDVKIQMAEITGNTADSITTAVGNDTVASSKK